MQESKHSKYDRLVHVWEIDRPEIIYSRQRERRETRDETIEADHFEDGTS